MLYFEEFDDSDELEEIPTGSEPIEEDFDDFDGDDDEEFEVDMDDLNTTLSQLGDDDLDFGDEDDFDDEDDDFDADVMDAISDDDNKSMEDRVDTTPEEELTPDEKKQAADDIAAAVPAMLIKTEMDATESVNFFSSNESNIALDEVRNYDPEILANCFPKNLPGDMFNSTGGQHELGQLQIQFSCIKYESPQINEVAKALLNKHRNFCCL